MARIERLYNENDYTEQYYFDVIDDIISIEGKCHWDKDSLEDRCEWEWEQKEQDIECLLMNLKYSKPIKNRMCAIVGSVGTWRGRFEIEPTFCNNIVDAVYKCIDGCELRSIDRIGNRIDISVYHHDGSNSFSIYFLSDIGEDRYYRNGDVSLKNKRNIFSIPQWIF
jgi:hypothetical protein